MIGWQFAAPPVLVAAAAAACISYFITPAPRNPVEADQLSVSTVPKTIDRSEPAISRNVQPPNKEDDITAYQRAAEAILRRAQNAKASADEPLFTGRIPLPKRRPLPRP